MKLIITVILKSNNESHIYLYYFKMLRLFVILSLIITENYHEY